MMEEKGKKHEFLPKVPRMFLAEPRRRIALSPSHYRSMVEAAWRPSSPEDIARFEDAFARYVQVREAVATSSGSQALTLLFEAHGLKPGDEVIVPAYTDESILAVLGDSGLVPCFVDIDPQTHTLDPAKVDAAVGLKTRAILAAHLFGVPADMDALCEIARRRKLLLFEDCAHAIGALAGGRPVGELGDGALFSFSYSKPFGLFGGGAAVCPDVRKSDWIRARMREKSDADLHKLLRNVVATLAMDAASHPLTFSLAVAPALRMLDRLEIDPLTWLKRLKPSLPQRDDTRLSGFQSRFGVAALEKLHEDLDLRIARGRRAIEVLGAENVIHSPREGDRNVFYFLLIRTKRRERLARFLQRRRIDTGHDVMRHIARLHGDAGSFPQTERAIDETLQIPHSPRMSEARFECILAATAEGLAEIGC